MAYYCDIEYEEAVLDDAIFVTYGVTVEEQALLSTLATEMASTLSIEAAVLDDLAVEQVVNLTTETALVSGVASSGLVVLGVLTDEAALGSSSVFVAVSYAYESAVLDDSTSQRFSNSTVETAQISDSVPDLSKKLNVTYESLYVSGVAGSVYVDVIEDAAVALGIIAHTKLVTALFETAALSSTAVAVTVADDAFEEVAVLADEASDALSGSNTSVETAYASGAAVAFGTRTGYAAHLSTLGMSRYDGLRARQFVNAGRTTLSLGDEAVYTLDETTSPLGFVLTGKVDFDASEMKRVPYVYASGEFLGGMQVTAYVDDDGEDGEYSYPFESRTGAATRTNRAIIGKGLRSRYWQFKLENTDELPFSVRSATAEAAVLSRRV